MLKCTFEWITAVKLTSINSVATLLHCLIFRSHSEKSVMKVSVFIIYTQWPQWTIMQYIRCGCNHKCPSAH